MFTKEAQALAKPTVEAIKKIAEKAGKKWYWLPLYRDACLRKRGYPGVCTVLISDGDILVKITKGFGRAKWIYADKLIPLFHWETIEDTLEKAGHILSHIDISRLDGSKTYYVRITKDGKHQARGEGNSRQLAVMQAVIELGEEINHD